MDGEMKMNDATHTPGPWFVEEDGWVSAEEYGPICMIQQGGFIDSGMFSSDRSNARLIAAAPELLDALENMIIAVAMGWDMDGVIDIAQAAISKARGQAQ